MDRKIFVGEIIFDNLLFMYRLGRPQLVEQTHDSMNVLPDGRASQGCDASESGFFRIGERLAVRVHQGKLTEIRVASLPLPPRLHGL